MARTDITQTDTTSMDTKVDDFSVNARIPDAASEQPETTYDHTDFHKYFGYYKEIPELKKAIDFLALWTSGKGWTADARVTSLLENMRGWGEDTFESILFNMIVMKKVAGDAFAEVIRNEKTGTLVNLKPLDPGSIRIVTNKKGFVIRYDQMEKSGKKDKVIHKFQPEDILHLCNDRVADEIHGVSIIESVQWVIDAKQEAMRDWRRISHRATVRILYIEEDDKTRLAAIKRDYPDAINKGELLILPIKKGDADFVDLNLPPVESFLNWIKYLENFFYQAVGVPKVILGGSEEFTEASSKIAYLTFEQVYSKEQREVEADFWNQIALRFELEKPVSLKNETLNSEEKNTGQVGFQQNDTDVESGR